MRKQILALVAAAAATTVCASVHFTPAGGSGNGLSWTLGQSATATFASADSIVFLTQGILQAPAVAYSSVEEIVGKPAPAVAVEGDKVTVSGGAFWSLADASGRLMARGSAAAFSIAGYHPGVYILSVEAENGTRTFKKIIRR